MSPNAFYNDYDTEPYGEGRPSDYRTPFQVDRDRIIHSSAFRKLQSKTQVYLSGEYDFYRTRLTHSIEVAQIGRSICNYLKTSSPHLSDDFFIDADLVEACCLSHDLGHPPFGHGGERALHRQFRSCGGFEGNAQTLRLIAETLYQSSNKLSGMSPTRAFIDGVLKYKSLFSELDNPSNHFIYDFQSVCRDFVHQADVLLVGSPEPNAFAKLSSIECQIMDWSDDTAYCINDIVDGVKAGFLTLERLESWAASEGLDAETQPLFDRFVTDIRRDRLEAIFSRKIGLFIESCSLLPVSNSLSAHTNRYAFTLSIDPEARRMAGFYKKVAVDLIFKSAPLQQMEFKGDRILESIFSAVRDCYLESDQSGASILPDAVSKMILQAEDMDSKWITARDYMASLTDGQALRIYKRLFDPEYGLIVDLE